MTDALGRLRLLEEQETPTNTYVTEYEYDLGDRLTDIALYTDDPGAPTAAQHRGFLYSTSGFLAQTVEPERTVDYLGYDAIGNLRRQTTSGITVEHDYDTKGRFTKTSEGTDPTVEQTWGDAQDDVIGQPGYNRVIETTRHNRFETDVAVTHHWHYHGPGGRPSWRKTLIGGLGEEGDFFALGYGYDLWGNRSELYLPTWNGCRYSDFESIVTQFDGPWLESVGLKALDRTLQVLGTLTYHPSGRIDTLSYGEEIAEWHEMVDPHGMARPWKIELTRAGQTVPRWESGEYGYDGAGNIRKIGQNRYTYDGLNRLTKYGTGYTGLIGQGSIEKEYAFDRWGNISSITSYSSSRQTTTSLSFDFALDADGIPTTNRIATVSDASKTSVSLNWDSRGNLAEQQAIGTLREKDFFWSHDDRLMESVDDPSGSPTTYRYAYDAAGERVAQWHDAGAGLEATIYLRDESGAVVSEWEYLSGGVGFDVRKDYVSAGSRAVAEVDHLTQMDEVKYIAPDHLGSMRLLFDEAGTVLEELEYLPFGQLKGAGADPETTHLFTGHERDLGEGSSELDYMHERYRSPYLARFVSVDPLVGEVGSSQSWNRYSYVENNPLSFVDLTGAIRVYAIDTGPTNGNGGGYRYRIKFDTRTQATADWLSKAVSKQILKKVVGPGGSILYRIGEELGEKGNKIFRGGGWVGIRAGDAEGFKDRFDGRLTSWGLEANIEEAFSSTVSKRSEYPGELSIFKRLEYAINMVVDSLDPTAFSEADKEFLRRIYNMESLKNMAQEDANYIGGADQRRDAWEELRKMGYLKP